MEKAKTKELDKYYTKTICAKHIAQVVFDMFKGIHCFIEPSAGAGNIGNYIIECGKNRGGFIVKQYDIEPEGKNIIKADYLNLQLKLEGIEKRQIIIIGNPPFGYKGALAVKFLNKALTESRAVAFIMPITALKYSLQQHINRDACLIYNEVLPDNSFELPNGSDYKCKAVFQIWTLQDATVNLRKQKPLLKHNDFELYRHNATDGTRKYLDYDWDFAVYSQGRKDYEKIFDKRDYDFLKEKINATSDQFYFVKTKDNSVLSRLLKIDYKELAYKEHITPGFCKNDIFEKYAQLYEN